MDIKIENWNGHNIRFVEVSADEWWAVAKDVSEALGYSDAAAMTRHLKSKYLTTVNLTVQVQRRKLTIISEQGIYKAVTRSQRPEAEDFEDWIFNMVKSMRKSSGLEGFQIFRMLDKEHQREMMSKLSRSLENPGKPDFIKANTIANKAVSSKYGHPKMLKKEQMTPQMIVERQNILDDTVSLMAVKDKFGLEVSVSEKIYSKYTH